ncbi:YjfK family protein [Paraburkholderia aspalathi]|nr:DUF2491 family protein [Paraburkholderia aspalathi]MBK3780302.1 YjfK family protein [Paraburkholderia aspalathi]
MSLFNLAGRIIDKKFDDAARAHAPKLDRVDTGLPYNAQLGALLEVPRAEFALLDGSLLSVPASAQLPIVAVSRIHLDADDDLALFRFYTATGQDRSGVGASFLQVVCRAGHVDDIQDVAYYQHLCRDFPVTDEEQAPYRGEGFGLGELTYEMADDKLRAIPQAASNLSAFIASADDALVFTRDTPGGDYVAPFDAGENRLDDAVGEKGMTKRLSFMPYVRDLAAGRQERLLISFDYVKTVDGRSATAAYVDFLAGLALDRNKVKVL